MKCTAGSGHGWWWRSQVKIFIGILVFAASASTVLAQEPSRDPPGDATIQHPPNEPRQDEPDPRNAPDAAKPSSKRGSLVIAPIPISSPAIGAGVTVIGAYIFALRKSDKISPPSVIGAGWVGTDNGTRAFGVGSELYFNQDRYHVLSGVAHADVNYDFYGTGTEAGDAGHKFGLNQTGNLVIGEALRRTFWGIFIGPRLWFGTNRLEPQHLGETNPELPPTGVDLYMRALGFKIERDTTPNRFYPTEGTKLEMGSDFFAEALGGTYTFQKYKLIFNSYRSFGDKQVLAYNLFACSTGGSAPFFGQCIFGTQDELRGYTAGRYIDKKMLATQVEYRRDLRWRMGVAVFGGMGEVAPSFSKFDLENILPSGGVGPRFLLSSKYHVNLRADFAWGKNGNTFSMGLGESF
jgi:hypothetical protein